MLYKKIVFNSTTEKFEYTAQEILDIVMKQTLLSKGFQGILLPEGCLEVLRNANRNFMIYPNVEMYNINKLFGYDILKY